VNAVESSTAHQPVTVLDPSVLARIANLELVARVVVEGFINGLHRAPHLGMSMDFAEHRAYMPGDDIRRIDWRLFGRMDRFYLKEFEADTNTNFSVLLDVSKSMSYGSGGINKLDYARILAACLAFFSHGQRDRVGLVTFDSDIVDFVPNSAKHLPVVLHTLARATAGKRGNIDAPMRKLSEHFRRRSIIAIISDLYDEPQRIIESLNFLRNRGNDLMVFHLLDPAELEFPFDDAASFEDMESGERLPVIPDYMRKQYRAVVRAHVDELTSRMGEQGIDYALFDTSKPLDLALFDYLSRRQRLARVR
jgi:uncharacterized protein (DUF58 family)